uniref:Exodeoxyribonuclease 8 n=1 Tax=Myoviridae sp. ctpjm1 TaxID=2826699 RepID=A0A8S5NP51_9CAUD|nr:MAG TPA: Exodeoxyribonuclease 8 [Myoviridae sp. ctpjm1]DAS09538.1 MAG TPA: Exodeoxyribonuclease 8 [Bacteriophage sp.]
MQRRFIPPVPPNPASSRFIPFIAEWGGDLSQGVSAPAAFAKTCANYRYHVQDAFYSEGYYRAAGHWPAGFVFIAVEKKPPYSVGVYTLDDTAKACGRELWQRELRSLKHARETNAWQSTYSSDIRTLSLPVWAITA